MAPGPQRIKVSIEALRKDAAMWDESADELREAARVANRLGLGAVHFSYLGDKVGLVDVYGRIQGRIIYLLNEGTREYEKIAASLRTAADGYERDEANAVHRHNNIY
jgi:hypothetical protein